MAATRIGAALAVIALVALAAANHGPPRAGASHSILRGVSLHYDGRRFEGRIKSDPPVCLNGLVTVRRIRRGPNPIVGSDSASPDGGWSVSERARRGRYYATTPSYETAAGLCRSVRSPVLDLG